MDLSKIEDLRLDSFEVARMQRTDDGFLDVWGVSSKVGDILEYVMPDGEVRKEFVSEKAIRSSLTTLADAPVVKEHPPGGKVNPDNAKTLQVGHVADVGFDEPSGELRVRLRITDSDAIESILSRETPELSPGYKVSVDLAAEEDDYDLIQIERTVNHLALTAAGRGETELRLDSQYISTPNRSDSMPKDERKDKEDERTDTADLKERMDALEEKLDSVLEDKKQREDAEKEKEREDADEKKREDDGDKERQDSVPFAQRFKEHRRALEVAEALRLDGIDETLSTDEIKRRVVKARLGESYRTDSSDERVAGTFDAIASSVAQPAGGTFKQDFEDAFRTDSSRAGNDDLFDVDESKAWLDRLDPLTRNKKEDA